MPDVEINIGERKFYVTCRAGEEDFLLTAAKLLDAEAQPIQSQLGRLPEARMLLMAGLMLADRMASVEEELRLAKARLSEVEGAAPVAGPAEDLPTPEAGLDPEALADLEELALRAEVLAGRIEEMVA